MLSFKNAGCDYSVYEVGLGGRLDATNVINPLCCCINQIEKEHTEFLGDTVEKIAAEKAGIIKEGVPVLVAPQIESVREVFRRKAGEKKSRIIFVDEVSTISDIIYKNKRMSFSISSNSPPRWVNFFIFSISLDNSFLSNNLEGLDGNLFLASR